MYLFIILLYSQNQSSIVSPGSAQNTLWHHKELFCNLAHIFWTAAQTQQEKDELQQ